MTVRERTPVRLDLCFSGLAPNRVLGVRRRLGIGAIAAAAVLATAQPSAATFRWLPPTSSFGETPSSSTAATIAPDGTVAVARITPDNVLEARIRPPGGDFGPATPIARDALGPVSLAAGRDGSIAAFWRGAVPLNMAAVRPPGGTFGAPRELDHESVPGSDQLAVDAGGRVWLANEYFGSGTVTTAGSDGVARSFPLGPDAGGPWFTFWVSLGIDASGRVTVVYTRTATTVGAADGDPCHTSDEVRVAEGDANGVSDVAVLATATLTGTTAAGFCEHQSGTELGTAKVAVQPDGEALVTYGLATVADDVETETQSVARMRPAGGGWPSSVSSPEPILTRAAELDTTPAFAGATPIAVVSNLDNDQIELSARAGDGSWSAPQDIAPGGGFGPVVAGSPSGTFAIIYLTTDFHLTGTVRGADGSVRSALGSTAGDATPGGVAMDDEGNGVAAWTEPAGLEDRAFLAGYDGAGPRLSATFPSGGIAGQPLPFSATALDVWSGTTISWRFGDRATGATGPSTSHVYGGAGVYTASVVARDEQRNATTLTANVPVSAAPDTLRPIFRGRPSVQPRRVRRGRRATIRFDVSEAATVRATLFGRRRGVRSGGRCVAPRRHASRRGRRCVRTVRLAQRSTSLASAGAGSIALGTRRLRPGGYAIVLQATDAAGNRSAAVRLHLTVLPRARR
jgi:hypothetical protein